jgi:hypothetical protein
VHKDSVSVLDRIDELYKNAEESLINYHNANLARNGFVDGKISISSLKNTVYLKEYLNQSIAIVQPILDQISELRKSVKSISAFSEQPTDLQNYYTYYRGQKWGPASDCEMMKVAITGIEGCKKVLGDNNE